MTTGARRAPQCDRHVCPTDAWCAKQQQGFGLREKPTRGQLAHHAVIDRRRSDNLLTNGGRAARVKGAPAASEASGPLRRPSAPAQSIAGATGQLTLE